MDIARNKKAPQKRGLVMLVGRARFELATNGLKDVELCVYSSRDAGLNLPGKGCGFGGWSYGARWSGFGVGWHRHPFVG